MWAWVKDKLLWHLIQLLKRLTVQSWRLNCISNELSYKDSQRREKKRISKPCKCLAAWMHAVWTACMSKHTNVKETNHSSVLQRTNTHTIKGYLWLSLFSVSSRSRVELDWMRSSRAFSCLSSSESSFLSALVFSELQDEPSNTPLTLKQTTYREHAVRNWRMSIFLF